MSGLCVLGMLVIACAATCGRPAKAVEPVPSLAHELQELDRFVPVVSGARGTDAYATALVRIHQGRR